MAAKLDKRSRFNLIELLVVINVIAILAALLLPALGKSREKAKRVKCMSNLKQIGISIQSYSVEYDEWFPENLDQLVATNILPEAGIYTCPSLSTGAEIVGSAIQNLSFHYITEHVDIDSVSAPDAGGNTSMVSDKKNNHDNYGNVLFSGGNVRGIAGERWYNDAEITSQLSEVIDPP